jgi:iron(III) transport system ATP-binding protein
MADIVIDFRQVSKYFGDTVAVRDASFSAEHGKLISLLGSSGCGKTTTLRLIAGLEMPDAGEIWLGGERVAGHKQFTPPERRHVGMVFQDYALFPHLTVADNIAFPLTKQTDAARKQRVREMLHLVGLDNLGARYPHELSGGQQQRVALARALASNPAVVLLDEPFSNLDAALRRTMREDLRAILQRAGATALFVTHDQEEALSISDVIVVMMRGEVVQAGTPHDVYLRPATREVAAFVGEANFIPGEADGDMATSTIGLVRLMMRARGPVTLMIRPEQLRIVPEVMADARIDKITFYGHDQLVRVRMPDGTCVDARTKPMPGIATGQPVSVRVRNAVMGYAE